MTVTRPYGVPVGLGLAIVAVRELDLFFTLPPLLSLHVPQLLLLVGIGLLGSAAALAIALRRSVAIEVSAVLREG